MSLRMQIVKAVVRRTRKPVWADPARITAKARGRKDDPSPPDRLTRRHAVSEREVEGFRVFTVTPSGTPGDTHAGTRASGAPAAVYLHGGGYISEIVSWHWRLIGRLADAGVTVEVPIYGLAPQHSFLDAYRLTDAVYRDAIERHRPSAVSVIGDSAGGGLAVGTVQQAVAAGLPAVGPLVLLAPWLDLTCSNPTIAEIEPLDPWLARAGAIAAGELWAHGTDTRDPRLSPLFGQYHGLPPVDLYIGTHDILYPEALDFAEQARRAGVAVEIIVSPGAPHVYPLLPVPEGDAAARRIVARAAALGA